MCGIVGYTGSREAFNILINGLKKLEYRGYDSAGLALQQDGRLAVEKAAGSIANLEKQSRSKFKPVTVGIGHTRWATHGRPTDENAHPHVSCCEKFAVVHNGIIENHQALRAWLRDEEGHRFRSQTDTEVLAHLVEEFYEGDLLQAVLKVIEKVEGSYAMVVLSAQEPGRLVCARKDSPLVIGLGDGENFVASDITALLAHTRNTYILEDGELASITAKSVDLCNTRGEKIEKTVFEVKWDPVAAEKGGYDHFMLKEIMEQPTAVRETLRQRVDAAAGRVTLDELTFAPAEIRALEKIYIVACGTAYHAGLVGKFAIEKLVGLPVEVDLASEFRYRDPLLGKNQLVIVISQSGETADTLAAMRLSRDKGVKVLAVTNVVGSSVSREADQVIFTWAGPEVAVASTKAYLTQLIGLYLVAIYLGQVRDTISPALSAELVKGLLALPGQLNRVLAEERQEELRAYAARLARWEDAFFLGRNLDYAVAMEGSLKLKEISYIHAEAYAAGELKHGTLALITEGIPVITLASQGAVLEKTLSNVQEVNARGGSVFAITQESHTEVAKQVDAIFYLPEVNDLLAPVLTAVPLQLIAYYAAVVRKCSVDKPRNLAKSVTVE
ncbi:MAG: glutamine--fructose-6-phosphate transaminase (isomerizing) [Bacillota bacterium]